MFQYPTKRIPRVPAISRVWIPTSCTTDLKAVFDGKSTGYGPRPEISSLFNISQ